MAEGSDRWSSPGFVERYLSAAEVIVVDRHKMVRILRSLYMHRMAGRSGRILDLGCGDGFLTRELLMADPGASAILVDGSGEMLRRAERRLSGFKVHFIRAGFDELVHMELPECDFAVSSLALHHLTEDEKMELLSYLHSLLAGGGGLFVNIDLVRAPSAELKEWYLNMWRKWIEERSQLAGVDESFDDLVERCIQDEHYSRLCTLEKELQLLKSAGFSVVDCFYKNGMFAMYGGATER